MKDSSTNTFSGGLQRDTHPLATPENVLTDALNATLLTMNGNENILQNDMGNARIESAYLPSGYVPVGMKEYGGVIYVASYNPLTKKGQVGSFPSPERNIDSNELDTATIDLSTMVQTDSTGELINTVHKWDLFKQGNKNVVFYPGDRFGIYVKNFDSISNLVSHYNTYDPTRSDIDYRKNNILTFDIAVLDADKNMRNITHTLKRFDSKGEVITFEETDSEDKKANTGYFIQSISGENTLENYRKVNPANIFNSKIAGSLYLIGRVNVVEDIDVSIIPKRENDKTTLTIKIKYKYNCPEGYIKGSRLIVKSGDDTIEDVGIEFGKPPITYEDGYFYATTTNNVDINQTYGTIDLEVTPWMDFCVLNSLKHRQSINLDLVNSGKIELTNWRYLWNAGEALLTWGFDAYPYEDNPISEVFIELTDVAKPNELIRHEMLYNTSYLGIFSEEITTLEENKIYKAVIKVNMLKGETKTIATRFIVTTTLFNDCFFPGEDLFIEDFGKMSQNSKYDHLFRVEYLGNLEVNSINSTAPELSTNLKTVLPNGTTTTEEFEYRTKQGYDVLVTYIPNFKNNEKIPFNIDSNLPNVTNKEVEVNSEAIIDSVSNNTIPGYSLNHRFSVEGISKISGMFAPEDVYVDSIFKSVNIRRLMRMENEITWPMLSTMAIEAKHAGGGNERASVKKFAMYRCSPSSPTYIKLGDDIENYKNSKKGWHKYSITNYYDRLKSMLNNYFGDPVIAIFSGPANIPKPSSKTNIQLRVLGITNRDKNIASEYAKFVTYYNYYNEWNAIEPKTKDFPEWLNDKVGEKNDFNAEDLIDFANSIIGNFASTSADVRGGSKVNFDVGKNIYYPNYEFVWWKSESGEYHLLNMGYINPQYYEQVNDFSQLKSDTNVNTTPSEGYTKNKLALLTELEKYFTNLLYTTGESTVEKLNVFRPSRWDSNPINLESKVAYKYRFDSASDLKLGNYTYKGLVDTSFFNMLPFTLANQTDLVLEHTYTTEIKKSQELLDRIPNTYRLSNIAIVDGVVYYGDSKGSPLANNATYYFSDSKLHNVHKYAMSNPSNPTEIDNMIVSLKQFVVREGDLVLSNNTSLYEGETTFWFNKRVAADVDDAHYIIDLFDKPYFKLHNFNPEDGFPMVLQKQYS